MFTLCNILADDFDDHDYVIDNNILPILIDKIKYDEMDVSLILEN